LYMLCKFAILLLVSCLLWSWAAPVWAQNLNKSEAVSQLNQLKADIASLNKELQSTRQSWSKEQQRLKQADLAIQANSKQLLALEQQRSQQQDQIESLQLERDDYLDSLSERRDALAMQIVAAFRLGQESRLKLILNQDSPAQFARTLAYFDYFSRSQASQIQELKNVLQTLDQMQLRINAELTALNVVQTDLQATREQLQNARDERIAIVDQLGSQIISDEQRLAELQNNQADLEKILEKLSDALADIPADLGKHVSPAELKGELPMPIKGKVIHAFGQSRSAGMRWQGWMIRAGSGDQVKAVAYGRVAYSDWLRGYGLLMIIDHGDGFMTLYGQNESLRYEVGDWVEPGGVIANVGASPDGGSGLYFEIRRNSKALDPAVWLKR
jgi:septal ring factor EnvC (AmiA/AmiB activator)